ncbi:MAG: NUDIX domain-containing protein, partial [Paracoccus sp. (in: a-proteobacteria)]|nr:NUDIX domain-containing protein [Paracoccus sp. (in: a-proteobacteria)]
MSDFNGTKLLLTSGPQMLVYLRDDRPDLPFPAHWDLPGGGREGNETPIACALRELDEEFSLLLPPEALRGHAFASFSAP